MNEAALSIDDLRSAMTRLFGAVEQEHGAAVDFEVDYYWNVPVGEAFEPSVQPTLDFGQVSDDVDSVRALVTSADDESLTIWHVAEHLAGVLRAIAHQDMPRP